jgi:hypothetical protein
MVGIGKSDSGSRVPMVLRCFAKENEPPASRFGKFGERRRGVTIVTQNNTIGRKFVAHGFVFFGFIQNRMVTVVNEKSDRFIEDRQCFDGVPVKDLTNDRIRCIQKLIAFFAEFSSYLPGWPSLAFRSNAAHMTHDPSP